MIIRFVRDLMVYGGIVFYLKELLPDLEKSYILLIMGVIGLLLNLIADNYLIKKTE